MFKHSIFVLLLLWLLPLGARAQDGDPLTPDGDRVQDSTLAAARSALGKDSTLIDEYMKIAAIYKARKQYMRELDLAKQMQQRLPASPFSYFLLGDASLDNGDAETSIVNLHTALKINPLFVRARVVLAEAYSLVQEWDSALYHLDTALLQNPRYAQAHVQRATLLLQLERTGEALENFHTAAELLPYSFDLWLKYGSALLKTEQFEQAADVLGYAVSLDTTSAEALISLADANMGAGRTSPAIACYRNFMLRFPTHARALDAERAARELGWRP